MAQLDRLLTQVILKAGSRLDLKADRKPRLELKSGEALDLLPNPLRHLLRCVARCAFKVLPQPGQRCAQVVSDVGRDLAQAIH